MPEPETIKMLIRNSGLFGGLDEREAGDLASVATISRYTPGSLIFSQGEPADAVYIIQSGEIDVAVVDLGEGALVGEPVLVEGTLGGALRAPIVSARAPNLPAAIGSFFSVTRSWRRLRSNGRTLFLAFWRKNSRRDSNNPSRSSICR